jgi:hypothetical protein
MSFGVKPKRRYDTDVLLFAAFALSAADAVEDIKAGVILALNFAPVDRASTAIESLYDLAAFDKAKLDIAVKFLKE